MNAPWHKVTFQTYTEAPSASGHPTRTYKAYASNVWVQFRTLSGRERIAAQQVNTVLTHEVLLPYTSSYTFKVDQRIVWGSRYFDIKDVRNVDEANRDIRMLVTEVLAAGPSASASPSSSPSASPSSSASA